MTWLCLIFSIKVWSKISAGVGMWWCLCQTSFSTRLFWPGKDTDSYVCSDYESEHPSLSYLGNFPFRTTQLDWMMYCLLLGSSIKFKQNCWIYLFPIFTCIWNGNCCVLCPVKWKYCVVMKWYDYVFHQNLNWFQESLCTSNVFLTNILHSKWCTPLFCFVFS